MNEPKTIKEAFERIGRMRELVEQAQLALDAEIYKLRDLAGGSTFEFEGERYQIRTPNHNRADRKHNAVKHPFIVKLKVMPRRAKAAAKLRKSGLSEEEAQKNLEHLLSTADDQIADMPATTDAEVSQVQATQKVEDYEDEDVETIDSSDFPQHEDVLAAGEYDDDMDDIVVE